MKRIQSIERTTTPIFNTSLGLSCIILILTFATYSRTFTFSFVHDDIFHLFTDPRLHSWEHWSGIFTEHLWSPLFPEGGNYYRPTTLFWFLIQNTLFGSNAALWHFAAVSLHVGVTALVHRLAYRILEDPLSAAAAALVFGLHPVHAESVAWISASVDPLMAFFTLSAFLCFLRWHDTKMSDLGGKTRWLAWSLLFYALAQLTKETAVVFPAIIFVSAYVLKQQHQATWRLTLLSALRAAIPYVFLTGLYLVVRILVLGRIAAGVDSAPMSSLLFTLPKVLSVYLQHLLFPVGLSPFYDTPYISSFSWAAVGFPLVLIALTIAGLVYWSRRSKVVPLASAWLFLPLLPVLNLSLLPEAERFHDRFLYLPSVGFVLLFGLAITTLKGTGAHAFGFPVFRISAVIGVCVALALGTVVQSVHWRDDMHLFRRAAITAPGNDAVLNNLGRQLIRSAQLDEAEAILQRVVARNPGYAMSLLNLGRIYFHRGDYERAQEYLLRASEKNPSDPDIYVNLGFIHRRISKPDQAEENFRLAIAHSRGRPGYGNPLGVLLRDQGRLIEALEVFEAELQLDSGQADVRAQVEQLRARIQAP